MTIGEGRFWEATVERAIKTLAQAALSALVITSATSAWTVNWGEVAGIAVLSAVVSVLTSIVGAGTGGDAGPSWGGIERIENRPLPGRGGGVDEDIVPEHGDG